MEQRIFEWREFWEAALAVCARCAENEEDACGDCPVTHAEQALYADVFGKKDSR